MSSRSSFSQIVNDKMSVVRAFTNRRVKQSLQTSEISSLPPRSSSTKGSAGLSIRDKISSPVELLHTTNVLAYNAPDLYPMPKTASSTGSSHRSDDDMSDALTAGTTPPTSPDIETSPKRAPTPKRPLSPEPNHLSAYFTAPGRPVDVAPTKTQAPVIPQRAPSHSKKTYNTLVRQRSASNVSTHSQQSNSTNGSYTFSRSSSSNSTATSTISQGSSSPVQHRMKHSGAAAAAAAFVAATPPPQVQRYQHRKEYSEAHPFGPELQQVSEIAEEYGVKEQVNVVDAEEKEMIAKGLLKFAATDYLGDIQGLISTFFVDEQPNPIAVAAAAWI